MHTASKLAAIAELDFVEYVHDDSVSERYRVLDGLVSKPKRGFISTSVLAQLKPTRQAWESGFFTFYVAAARSELVNLSSDRLRITRILWLAAPKIFSRRSGSGPRVPSPGRLSTAIRICFVDSVACRASATRIGTPELTAEIALAGDAYRGIEVRFSCKMPVIHADEPALRGAAPANPSVFVQFGEPAP